MKAGITPGGLDKAELIASYKESRGEQMIMLGGWAYYPDDVGEFARQLLVMVQKANNNNGESK